VTEDELTRAIEVAEESVAGFADDGSFEHLLAMAVLELKDRVLETKDKPVAWGMETEGLIYDVICPDEHEREEGEYTIPLYTHPKEWVGLTDEEYQDILKQHDGQGLILFYHLIEAKLKEKNNG
jgi:hypothetical protein